MSDPGLQQEAERVKRLIENPPDWCFDWPYSDFIEPLLTLLESRDQIEKRLDAALKLLNRPEVMVVLGLEELP